MMDVDVVGKFLSTLPEDDDHPYRTGPWRPQTTEWRADDLIAVEGEIPADRTFVKICIFFDYDIIRRVSILSINKK